jgi:hypothetical protein
VAIAFSRPRERHIRHARTIFTRLQTVWTTITRAVLRIRGRHYDFSGSAVEKSISFTVRNLTSLESVLFTSPSLGQCSSGGWKTYEAELDVLNDNAALWSGVILDMDGRSSKVAAAQVSALEICIEGA